MVFPSNEGGTRVISRSIGGRPDSQRANESTTSQSVLATRMNIRWLTRLAGRFFWSASALAKPPFVTVLQVEVDGLEQVA